MKVLAIMGSPKGTGAGYRVVQKIEHMILDSDGIILPKPGFNDYVRFVTQQHPGTECKEWLPADYEFYNGKAYYYEAPVSPAVKVTAGVMLRFVFFLMKDMGPGTVKWPAPKNKGTGEKK